MVNDLKDVQVVSIADVAFPNKLVTGADAPSVMVAQLLATQVNEIEVDTGHEIVTEGSIVMKVVGDSVCEAASAEVEDPLQGTIMVTRGVEPIVEVC